MQTVIKTVIDWGDDQDPSLIAEDELCSGISEGVDNMLSSGDTAHGTSWAVTIEQGAVED